MVPRHYLAGRDELPRTHDLIGFCDASQSAYAAVVYLRAKTGHQWSSTLLAAKTRVAPLKIVTIPRLELLSGLLLARLMRAIHHALESEIQLDMPTCYTDSQIALCWIKEEDKEWKQFVENRVSEIRRLVPAKHWKHCAGTENPADIPSRGTTPTNSRRRSTSGCMVQAGLSVVRERWVQHTVTCHRNAFKRCEARKRHW